MAALGGAAVGIAARGIIAALERMDIPEFEAKRYDAKIREGNILISVHTKGSAEKGARREIFKRNDVDDISTCSETSDPWSRGIVNEVLRTGASLSVFFCGLLPAVDANLN